MSASARPPAGLPSPADFAPPPKAADLARWAEADRAARPARLARLRARFEAAGIDAYFGLRREHMRYLTGFTLGDGEEKVAGTSGLFLIGREDVIVLADSRYTIQAHREVTDGRIVDGPRELANAWAELVASVGARRVGVEADVMPHAVWRRLETAAQDVELVPIEGWVEQDRAIKEPAELERVGAACAVADRALATLLPKIRPGATEHDLALELEWLMRTGGAEAVAFEPTCLVG
ncbi:MAG TPA: aminopeptidase P family N-terminal domain-containing protein, partial [Candidatus Limnocylindrales bacterium]